MVLHKRVFGPNWSTIRTVITQEGCMSMRNDAPFTSRQYRHDTATRHWQFTSLRTAALYVSE